MDDDKWSYVDQRFTRISHSRPTEERDEKMAPPTKETKISSWHAIEYPLKDLLEMDKAELDKLDFSGMEKKIFEIFVGSNRYFNLLGKDIDTPIIDFLLLSKHRNNGEVTGSYKRKHDTSCCCEN